MQIPSIPYSISQVRMVKSIFSINPAFRPPLSGFPPLDQHFAIKHYGSVDPTGLNMSFRQNYKTTDNDDSLPFSFDIELEATIHLERIISDRDRDFFILNFLPQVIFPYTREYVADLTRRSGYPTLMLNENFVFSNPAPVSPKTSQFN